MNKLYACISGVQSAECGVRSLVQIAQRFSHRVEAIEDGVLFDMSGMHNRIGSPAEIAETIAQELATENIAANVAVAANARHPQFFTPAASRA